MPLRILSVEDKLTVVERLIRDHRRRRLDAATVEGLKALAKDLRALVEIPRSNALGELERALKRMEQSKTDLGYDRNRMAEVAKVVVNKWPFIRQAMEEFGEESAE
jgi:hypothetical protein